MNSIFVVFILFIDKHVHGNTDCHPTQRATVTAQLARVSCLTVCVSVCVRIIRVKVFALAHKVDQFNVTK